MANKLLKVAGKVGLAGAAVGSAAVLVPTVGAVAIAKKSRNVLEDKLDVFGDDLFHVLTQTMSFSPLEEGLASKGHERCAPTQMRRPVPWHMMMSGSDHSMDSPDF